MNENADALRDVKVSNTTAPELVRTLDYAVELAREAGEITLRYFKKRGVRVEEKSDGSPVTIADKEAESFLRENIRACFPEDSILGEEEGLQEGASGRRWILDPIDGTFSFVRGVPFYAVLIGIEIDDDALAGVVNLPALGEIVYAARGVGCFLNGEAARVSDTTRLEDSLLLCTDFGTCAKYGFGAAAEELQKRAAARRTWGDAYGHILVATGRAEAMLDPVMNVWDCAPLLPILEEAGGTFNDWRGARTIRGGNAISTNKKVFDSVMRTIQELS